MDIYCWRNGNQSDKTDKSECRKLSNISTTHKGEYDRRSIEVNLDLITHIRTHDIGYGNDLLTNRQYLSVCSIWHLPQEHL